MNEAGIVALAREFVRAREEYAIGRHAGDAYLALRDAVLSEPAAEAGGLSVDDLERAQANARRRDCPGALEEIAALRARLATLEPLCRAAVEYRANPNPAMAVIDEACKAIGVKREEQPPYAKAAWALHEAANAYADTAHGQEFAKGMKP